MRPLGSERYPREERCHIGLRLDTSLSGAGKRIQQLLDLEEPIPDDQRSAELVQLMQQSVLPLVERGCSIEGLRAMHEDGTLDGAAIRGPAYGLLGVEPRF